MRWLTRSRSLVVSIAWFAVLIQAGFAQLPCDYNGDAQCTFADLDLMYANWGPSNGQFDADGSGTVDTDDIVAWLAQASVSRGTWYLPGDVNLNRSVDEIDLFYVLNFFGDTGRLRSQGNLNDDPYVNGTDLAITLNDFGDFGGVPFPPQLELASVVPRRR